MSSPEQEREICARIKQARVEAGLTQDEFADLLKVEKRTVQNYEADRVPWRYLKDIAKITGRTQEWLLRGDVFDLSQMDRLETEVVAIQPTLGQVLSELAEIRQTLARIEGRESGGGRTRRAQ